LDTNNGVPGRVCYLAIKNGYIVYESYYDNWSETRARDGWSTTKSHCSSLFGVATEQGWADPLELVASRNDDTRNCNSRASFQHVLTMTGESSNINDPSFSYDTTGTGCLDTLSDFVDQNNPGSLRVETFKDLYWQNPLGMENFEWENYLGYLHCGYTSVTSCRDLGRAAQLWVNEGAWPDHGQIISRQHILDGRTHIFEDAGSEYGYNVWLDTRDPVDDEVHSFVGMYSQCAHISKEHEAIIVSMGDGDISGALCGRAWTYSRDAVVSSDKRKFNSTRTPGDDEPRNYVAPVTHEEILEMKDYVRHRKSRLTEHEFRAYNEYLKKHGLEPIE